MRAAIYARKSTEQNGVVDESKSVTRQTDGGRRFCESKKWTVAAVYEDDGVSGAFFATRPEFQRMLRDAEAGVFEALVLFDLDRLGRHGRRTMEALHKLTDLGVGVWDYSTGLAVDLESFEGDISQYLKAKFAEQFREQIRKATRAAMFRKAELGYATGGRIFGYDNVRIAKGHAELQINETEAAVVRDIFERAGRGEGARTIAAALNALGVPSPGRNKAGRAAGALRPCETY